MDDLETAVEMFNLCALDEIGVASVPLDGIRNEWTLPDFDLDTSTRAVFTPEGQIVGYVEVWDLTRFPAAYVCGGVCIPNTRGRALAPT
jgi:hypothetical protein